MNDDGLIDDNEYSTDDYEFVDIDESMHYRVLKRDDITKSQEDDITLLSSAISVSRTVAVVLLQHYAWNGQKAQDAWFDDEGVRKFVGLTNRPANDVEVGKSGELLVCGICFEFYVFDKRFESLADFCGHRFCSACLEIYVSTAIRDGPGCLFSRCPDPSCRAVIGEDMVSLLVSDKDNKKYKEFLFRSYVENNKKIKWCPAPGCQYAIAYKLGSESYDVTCDCSLSFCWNCEYSRERALADLHELRTKKLQQLEEILCQTTERLKFITEAWEQVAECRRVLKWTYAYGYYMPKKASLEKELFEYLQGEAEVALERLHDCAENTLKKYFELDGDTHEFDTKFRTKLVDLTRVTRNYFENFVKGAANGLSEVKGSITDGIRTIRLKEG